MQGHYTRRHACLLWLPLTERSLLLQSAGSTGLSGASGASGQAGSTGATGGSPWQVMQRCSCPKLLSCAMYACMEWGHLASPTQTPIASANERQDKHANHPQSNTGHLLQEQQGQTNPISARSMETHTPTTAQTRATSSTRFPSGRMQPQLRRQLPELLAADAPQESAGVAPASRTASRQTLVMAGYAQPPTPQPPRCSSVSSQAEPTQEQLA